jgi:hypothetical protein
MQIEVDNLATTLRWALGGDGNPLLAKDQAQRRAKAIKEEVEALGFDLQVSPWKNVTLTGELHPYPAYQLDDPRYDLDAVEPGGKGQFAVNGPGISCGDLLKFGRACELKQEFLGTRWPKELKDNLLDPQSHLDAVEEVLWIGRFQGVRDVRCKVVQPNGKDVDWAFVAYTQPIQVEVKHRRKECTGIIDGAHRGRGFPSWYQDFDGKFSRDAHGSLNIACVTTYFDTDEAIRERADELLNRGDPIDAIVIWSCHCRTSNHLTIFSQRKIRQALTAILAPIPREDSEKVLRLEHLLRNTAEQRVVTLEETFSHLRQLHRQ